MTSNSASSRSLNEFRTPNASPPSFNRSRSPQLIRGGQTSQYPNTIIEPNVNRDMKTPPPPSTPPDIAPTVAGPSVPPTIPPIILQKIDQGPLKKTESLPKNVPSGSKRRILDQTDPSAHKKTIVRKRSPPAPPPPGPDEKPKAPDPKIK
jgi:hypothetical protein